MISEPFPVAQVYDGIMVKMVEASEYKRRQAPPGVKIQPKAFGKDRRVPISHGERPGRRVTT